MSDEDARDENSSSGPRGRFFLPPSLSISFNRIDEQHQALIDIINLAATAPKRLDVHLRELNVSLSEHFAHEEGVMEAEGYPQLTEHKIHHSHILRRVQAITDGLAKDGKSTRDGLENIFTSLIDDILRADLPFKSFLQGKGLIVS
jgi:hemerythrin-like metal-binding protein